MSRTPSRTNSSISATEKAVAGESVFRRVIVEVSEFLFETTDALVLFFVSTQVPQERRVVIRGDRVRLCTTIVAFLADREPEDRPDHWHYQDDEHPQDLVERTHPALVRKNHVDDRKDIQGEDREGGNDEQAGHWTILGSHGVLMLSAYTCIVKPWLAYSIIRVLVFGAAFAGLLLLRVEWWLAAVLAAVIGLCVAYIFFGRLRDSVASDLVAHRLGSAKDTETEAEDEALERNSER